MVRLAYPYVAGLAQRSGFPPFTGEMPEGQRGRAPSHIIHPIPAVSVEVPQ